MIQHYYCKEKLDAGHSGLKVKLMCNSVSPFAFLLCLRYFISCIYYLHHMQKTNISLQEEKKKFDKQTEKYCLTVQNYLNLSYKKKETILSEVCSI